MLLGREGRLHQEFSFLFNNINRMLKKHDRYGKGKKLKLKKQNRYAENFI